MDAIEQLKQDLRDGRIDVERLIAVIVTLQQQLEAAKQRIAELEKKSGGPTPPVTAKVDTPFSLREEEKRQKKRGKNKRKLTKKARRGRVTSADKLKSAERTEQCFPQGLSKDDCQLSHTRPVWRLEKGRAVLVAYEIYRGPKNQYGKITGVLGRSEFGMEIVVQIAYVAVHSVNSPSYVRAGWRGRKFPASFGCERPCRLGLLVAAVRGCQGWVGSCRVWIRRVGAASSFSGVCKSNFGRSATSG